MSIPKILGYCGDRFDNERRWTPPQWMRHLLSMRALAWISAHTDTCWANMVMWKLGYDKESWWPTPTCFKPYDYCGKFDGKPLPDMPDPVYITFHEQTDCGEGPIPSGQCTETERVENSELRGRDEAE